MTYERFSRFVHKHVVAGICLYAAIVACLWAVCWGLAWVALHA